MTDIIWGATKKPVSSERLANAIEASFPGIGFLYIGYPVLSGADGFSSIDALWISPTHGILIFHLVEGRDINNYQEAQDELANNLETRFRPHKNLMSGRTLLASPIVVTYAPSLTQIPADVGGNYAVANDNNLISLLRGITWDRSDLFEAAHSVVQSISSIRKSRRRRVTTKQDSHGSKLRELEESIANLDSLQSRAVIETVAGVQRIRGLAGSGKTIILALKAAYLHSQYPDWKIAVTFNTRSLKGQFRRLIETFALEQAGEQPDWDKIQIVNAWGAPGGAERTGVYYQFCRANGIEFLDFQNAKARFSQGEEFAGVCRNALASVAKPTALFDVVLVDEAQDFDPQFLRLCYASLGPAKRLVYAYDELQSLTESSLPPPEELFGNNADGSPRVVFAPPEARQPTQDIILEKCYRNSRPVLATAHALGFGIYRNKDPKTDTGLIQMFDRAELWSDVGYSVLAGNLQDNSAVTLGRTASSSPEFLERPGEIDRLVEFLVFADAQTQAEWLADQICKNIQSDELLCSDIIVINPNPLTTVKQAGLPRRLLFEKQIQSHVAGVDTSSDVFFKSDEDSVAFTGIFRAKGNEAGMVYVMNAQDCFSSYGSLGKVRNQLFTSITRSKAWVKVLGIGPSMTALAQEFDRVAAHSYTLEFIYPGAEKRKILKILNRDLSPIEQKKIKGARSTISTLVSDIEAGQIQLDDLPKEELDRLRRLLASRGGDDHS